jgi:transcriptional regulator with XRE-family HTH domain
MRGRHPQGVELVAKLSGSDQARERLQVILEVVAGRCRAQHACARLGLGEDRLRQIRKAALQGALEALEPKAAGRPRCREEVTAGRVAELEAQVAELGQELQLSRVREEVARILPDRPAAASAGEKNGPAAPAGEVRAGAKEENEAVTTPALAAASQVRPRRDGDGRQRQRLRGHRRARSRHRQQAVRQREEQVRRAAVVVSAWARGRGLTQRDVARKLGLSARSLRRWPGREAVNWTARGRPVVRAERRQRQEVLEWLAEVGPRVGVPQLRRAFAALPRAELEDLLRRYRRVCRRCGGPVARLQWTQAGAVWAADWAWPPEPVEGWYERLLSVRDLASGSQLTWRPVAREDGATAAWLLERLFTEHGAPLVLKVDNGPAWRAAEVAAVLARWRVVKLPSPAYEPSYNGAVEAGIGSLKGRTEEKAWQRGEPGQWTWEDAEAARREANERSRPMGRDGESAREVWAARPEVTAEDREELVAEARRITAADAERSAAEQSVESAGTEAEGPKETKSQEGGWRGVLRRALEALGYLKVMWRRIPRRIQLKKGDKIM